MAIEFNKQPLHHELIKGQLRHFARCSRCKNKCHCIFAIRCDIFKLKFTHFLPFFLTAPASGTSGKYYQEMSCNSLLDRRTKHQLWEIYPWTRKKTHWNQSKTPWPAAPLLRQENHARSTRARRQAPQHQQLPPKTNRYWMQSKTPWPAVLLLSPVSHVPEISGRKKNELQSIKNFCFRSHPLIFTKQG